MSDTRDLTLGRINLQTTIAVIRENENLSDNNLPGLSYFDTSFEDRVREVLTSETPNKTSDYNPLLITQLFADITAILNRCLSYQRDYLGFEQSALQAARDYKAYDDQKENQKAIERADYLLEVAKKQKETSQSAAKEVATVLVAQLEVRAALIDTKYEELERCYTALKKRHEIFGSSLNYKERATSLWTFLTVDLKEGYLKIKAVAKGAAHVYGLSAFPSIPIWVHGEKPKNGEEGALGQLVMWATEMVRLINIEEEQYSDMYLTVPLRSGTTGPPSNIPYGVMSPDQFKAFLRPDALVEGSFSVRASVPQSMTRLRLYGVGLTYLVNTADGTVFERAVPWWSHQVTSAIIFPPNVPPELAYANSVTRAPIVIDDVALSDGNSNARVIASDDILNVDPLGYEENSPWRIVLSPLFSLPYKDVVMRISEDIIQIYLHLKVRGKLNRDPFSWNFTKTHG